MSTNATIPTRRKDRRLMEEAYGELKRRVITLELHPGERIDELKLIEELGLSRTPIREALFRLASEGLISIASRSGFVVRRLDLSDITGLLEVHLVFSKAVAALAALRARPDDIAAMEQAAADVAGAIDSRDYAGFTNANAAFHRIEAATTGNAQLREMADSVLDQCRRVSFSCFRGHEWEYPGLARHFETLKQHHAELIAAYAAHDVGRAQQIASAHSLLFRARVQARLDSPEGLDTLAFAPDELIGGHPAQR
jgi:DNA-binding GntR family transcriptional regulator